MIVEIEIGRYTLRCPTPDEKERNFHEILMKQTKKRAKKARKKPTNFPGLQRQAKSLKESGFQQLLEAVFY